MGRRQHPEPFWWKARSCWYVQVGGKQIRLAPDRDEAWRLYHELMARPPEARAQAPAVAPATATAILDEFLGWVAAHRSPRTYEWYRGYLQALADSLPEGLRADELRPWHVARALDGREWGAHHRYNFGRAAKRASAWAARMGLLASDLLGGYENPSAPPRDDAVSPADHAAALAAAPPALRTLLELAWETGARPQELFAVGARHLHPDGDRLVLPPREGKGGRLRVIYLGTERARAIVAEGVRRYPAGPLLRNAAGKGWTKNSANCAFRRLRDRMAADLLASEGKPRPPVHGPAGKDAMRALAAWKSELAQARERVPRWHLGAWRKGYATEALKRGVDPITLAHLLGHSTPVMLARVYAKVGHDPRHMAEAARRARGEG